MTRILTRLSIALVALATPVSAGAQDGTWRVSYVAAGAENVAAIVKIKDGGTTGELVAASPRLDTLTLESVTRTKDRLRIVMKLEANEFAFEAVVPPGDNKRLTGVMSIDGTLLPAWIETTTDAMIDKTSVSRKLNCPPHEEAKKLAQRVNTLRNQYFFSKDADKKKDLLKQLTEAADVAKKETPRLYREAVAKHADNPAVFEAAVNLIKSVSDAKEDEIHGWAKAANSAAKAYGSRYQIEIAAQIATALLAPERPSKLGLEYARQAEKLLTSATAPSDQVRALSVLAHALRKNGFADEMKKIELRAEPFEVILDKEYSAKMPPFKGTAFTGRKGKSERAVFMELFTGATCPPCVAADLAFDVLQKTYKQNELVLIQYHLHIPGPDTMTNPDTTARWEYYRKAYPTDVRGVPSSIFNGKPAASSGGPAAYAEKKYRAYREVIEPLLEEPAAAKLGATAVRKGDRVDISVNVDFGAPGPNKKLRVLLAEETVRYLGSNRIRLHHNVVRACPGGVEGSALTEASTKFQASVDLGKLRGELTKYLDEFEQGGRAFLNPARPMNFENLRVIAFVQDDATHEILQAAQVEVERK